MFLGIHYVASESRLQLPTHCFVGRLYCIPMKGLDDALVASICLTFAVRFEHHWEFCQISYCAKTKHDVAFEHLLFLLLHHQTSALIADFHQLHFVQNCRLFADQYYSRIKHTYMYIRLLLTSHRSFSEIIHGKSLKKKIAVQHVKYSLLVCCNKYIYRYIIRI